MSAPKPKGNYTPKAKVSASTAARVNQFLEGEDMVDQAIHQGIISAGLSAHFRALMKSDPTNTRAYLQGLGLSAPAAQSQPVAVAAASDEYPTSGLSAAERGRIAAAREGRQSVVVHGGL